MKTLQKLCSLVFILLVPNIITYSQDWSLTGNAGTTPGTNFLGTTDNKVLLFKVNNQKSGYLGTDVTEARTAFGYQALNFASGGRNSAFGYKALSLTTKGSINTAVGAFALADNSTGTSNTAVGVKTLYFNKSGTANVAIGNGSLYSNTVGHHLVAVGDSALFNQALGTSPVCEFCDTSRAVPKRIVIEFYKIHFKVPASVSIASSSAAADHFNCKPTGNFSLWMEGFCRTLKSFLNKPCPQNQ